MEVAGPMQLRVNIEFVVEAESFGDAAQHEAEARRLLGQVQGAYPSARLDFRQLPAARRPPEPAHRRLRRSSGAVMAYEDA